MTLIINYCAAAYVNAYYCILKHYADINEVQKAPCY